MTRRIRIIGLLVLLLVGTTSLVALPDHEIFYTYYTDATYTVECGYRYVTCSGVYSSGCRTTYVVIEQGADC
ncbi:MAG TPA: hypothetical protein VF883_23245 [Thermoanaerobaculia bacterium]|jgi:hypothetical protein